MLASRRCLLAIAAATLAQGSAAALAQSRNAPRVGFLFPGPGPAAAERLKWIFRGMQKAGYTEPHRIEVLRRVAEGDIGRLDILAGELAALQPDVVIAVSLTAMQAMRTADRTIPIVAHDLDHDPVALGFIQSYARPGGMTTGVFFDYPNFRTKWLELLKETMPTAKSIAVVWNPVVSQSQLELIERAAADIRLQVKALAVRVLAELGHAFAEARQADVDALLVLSSPLFGTRAQLLGELALQYRLPMISLYPEFAHAGGLLAYGPDLPETYASAGMLLSRVLRGSKPADLPVERPSKFELVVNMKTAKDLGIEVPASVLGRADEVIE